MPNLIDFAFMFALSYVSYGLVELVISLVYERRRD